VKRRIGSVALLLGSVLSIAMASAVYAAWTANSAPGGLAASRAATLPQGSTPTAANAGGSSVTVSWPATLLPDGNPVAAYVVRVYDSTTDTPRAIGPDCDAGVTTTTCTESNAPDGSWRYTVEPRQGLWFGPESLKSTAFVVDTVAPTATIDFPDDASTHNPSSWNTGCAATICGTAADTTSGVASIEVSVQDPGGNYWDGDGFDSATEVLNAATGTTSWTLAFPAANFVTDGAYTVRAVATDDVGLTGDDTNSFTFDETEPTSAITFPADAGIFNDASWNAGCTSTICGTAADTTSGVASIEVSVKDPGGNYWDGDGFDSATEVLNAATGTTSWSLAFPATNFPANGDYTVRAVATDGAGNTDDSTATFTIDRTDPTVAIAFPADAATYDNAEWDAGCTSTICGTAAGTGSATTLVEVSILDTTSGLYWNGAAFSSGSEAFQTATGTAIWSLAFPSANFPANGSYTVHVVATDGAGNTGSSVVTFTISN